MLTTTPGQNPAQRPEFPKRVAYKQRQSDYEDQDAQLVQPIPTDDRLPFDPTQPEPLPQRADSAGQGLGFGPSGFFGRDGALRCRGWLRDFKSRRRRGFGGNNGRSRGRGHLRWHRLFGWHLPMPLKVPEPVDSRLQPVDSALQPAQQEDEDDNGDEEKEEHVPPAAWLGADYPTAGLFWAFGSAAWIFRRSGPGNRRLYPF